jgi:uncharacterized protein YaaN involved in tellurite resistance
VLKNQTAAIHDQATSPTVSSETIRRAFQNVYSTMDALDTFKAQALQKMQQTVGALTQEIEKSREYFRRTEGGDGALGKL